MNKTLENKGKPPLKSSSTAVKQPALNEVLRPSGWRAAVEAIEIDGVTKTLALNCEMRSIDEDNSIFLVLDESHSSLLSEDHVRKISLALTAFYSQDYKIHVEIGQTLAETPAEEIESVKNARKAVALEKLKNDPIVIQAIKAFDGTLDLESVSPIDN